MTEEMIFRIVDVKLGKQRPAGAADLTLRGVISVEEYLDLARHSYFGHPVRVELVQMELLADPEPEETPMDRALNEIDAPLDIPELDEELGDISEEEGRDAHEAAVLEEHEESVQRLQAEAIHRAHEAMAEPTGGRLVHYVSGSHNRSMAHLTDKMHPWCGRDLPNLLQSTIRGGRHVCENCLKSWLPGDRFEEEES